MPVVRALLTLLFCLLLPACMVQTQTFLSEREASQADERLIGTWVSPDNEGEIGFALVREAGEGGMELLMLEFHEDDETGRQSPRWDVATFWPTEIAGANYLNLASKDGRMIFAYRLNGPDRIELGYMNPETFAAAVRAGTLTGTVKKGFLGEDIRLTGTADELRAYLEANGGHALFLFEDNGTGFVLERKRFRQ